MFSLNCALLMAAVSVLTVSTSPIRIEEYFVPQLFVAGEYEYEPFLARHRRSPEGGNFDLNIKKDQFGREASASYNHNLFTSSDGRGTIDAYAQASRNFDHNQNDFKGGIRGSFSF